MRKDENVSVSVKRIQNGSTQSPTSDPECYVTEDMRTLLQDLADIANQASDEVYDDDDAEHGTAGILHLCDLLVTKIDAYLER